MKFYTEVEKIIKDNQKFLIGAHINPDGDAIGSTLALGALLKHFGKEVVMYNRDRVPDNLRFLKGFDQIVKTIPSNPFDVAIMVDCASKDRAGLPFMNAKIVNATVVIDHHRLDTVDAAIALLDETAASAGEVVLRLIEHMKFPITQDIAMQVYCTLAVDTGFFKYSNTSERVLRVAADLVAKGASPWKVAMNLEESYPIERFHLLARALDTLEVSKDGKYATMEVTQNMISQTNAPIQISEEFAGIPRSIKSVKISALFREVEDGKVRVSLRSKDSIDVAAVASKFGGGGHPYAAGCTIEGTVPEAKQIIKKIISTLVK